MQGVLSGRRVAGPRNGRVDEETTRLPSPGRWHGEGKAKAENSERELQMRALGGQIGFSSSNAVPLFGVEAGTKGC